jgi:predicted DNA-binding ribbon-helix-helix protein
MMDIAARKLNFVQRFLRLSDEKTIGKLEKLLFTVTSRLDKISPMTIEEFYAMIDESENDHNNGNVIEAKDILNQIDKW